MQTRNVDPSLDSTAKELFHKSVFCGHLGSANVESFTVVRWSDEEYSQGSWSQLLVGGSAEDRIKLGEPISRSLVLAGEACSDDMPAMVNGAYLSGISAAEWAADSLGNVPLKSDKLIVIIGAGPAGLSAGRHLKQHLSMDSKLPCSQLVIFEARGCIGGRARTVIMPFSHHGSSLRDSSRVTVDSGAMFLQQFSDNVLVEKCRNLGLTLHPIDFNNPVSAAGLLEPQNNSDMKATEILNPVAVDTKSVSAMISAIGYECYRRTASDCGDVSVLEAIHGMKKKCAGASSTARSLSQTLTSCDDILEATPEDRLTLEMALVDIMADTGVEAAELSAKFALDEPGVGDNDHFIKEGYGALWESMAEGLDIRYNSPVREILWGDAEATSVTLVMASGERVCADMCICTVPISLIQKGDLLFTPQLPQRHRLALSRLKMSVCDKIIIRFRDRWWPPVSSGVMHWYGCLAKLPMNTCDGGTHIETGDEAEIDVEVGIEAGEDGVDDLITTSLCTSSSPITCDAMQAMQPADAAPDFPPPNRSLSSSSAEQASLPLSSLIVQPTWFEWCDLTEGLGEPVVVGFVTGEDAVRRVMRGKSDEEVLQGALIDLQRWAFCVREMDKRKASAVSNVYDD